MPFVKSKKIIYINFTTARIRESAKVAHDAFAITYRNVSDDNWNPVAGRGLSGYTSRPSPTLLLGLDVGSASNAPFLRASAIFFERPRRFSRLPVLSIVALRKSAMSLGIARGVA